MKLSSYSFLFLIGRLLGVPKGISNAGIVLFVCLLCSSTTLYGQTFRWATTIATSVSDDAASEITLDEEGNFYVIGIFRGTVFFNGGSVSSSLTAAGIFSDYYIAKFNCQRNLIWANRIGGGSNLGLTLGVGIKYDHQGNIYVTGSFLGTSTLTTQSGSAQVLTSSGNYDAFLAKYDTSGVLQWGVKTGGTGHDYGSRVAIDQTGNIICCGSFSGTAIWGTTVGSTLTSTTASPLYEDAFIAKYNNKGQPIWVTKVSGLYQDVAVSVDIDKQNNIYCSGWCGSGAVIFGSLSYTGSGYIAKMDPNGVWQWVNGISGTGGGTNYHRIFCAVDDFGNVCLALTYGGSQSLTSSAPGLPITLPPSPSVSVCLAQYSNSGVLNWANSIKGAGAIYSGGICLNPQGNVFITGNFANSIDFGGKLMTSAGAYDVYVSEYTSNGTLIDCVRAGSIGNDAGGHGLACGPTGRVYVSGAYVGTATFGSTILSGLGGLAESFIAEPNLEHPFELNDPPIACVVTLRSLISFPANSTFTWLKDSVVIPGETRDSLIVSTPGAYQLIVTNACQSDTSLVRFITFPNGGISMPDKTICFGDSVQLSAGPGTSYFWTPATGLSNRFIANPYAKPLTDQIYVVWISTGSCVRTDTIRVLVKKIVADAGADLSLCLGDSVRLAAGGGTSYLWTPTGTLSDPTIANPYAWPQINTKYFVTVKDGLCSGRDSVSVIIVPHPTVVAGIDTTICLGDSVQLSAVGNANIFAWSPQVSLSYPFTANPYARPTATQTYFVRATNGACAITDSVTVFVRQNKVDAGPNQNICAGDSIRLNASGGIQYTWTSMTTLSDTTIFNPYAKPIANTMYYVRVNDSVCTQTDSVAISVSDKKDMYAGSDSTICLGDFIQLFAVGGLSYNWYPSLYLTDGTVATPYTNPLSAIRYFVTITKGLCTNTDSVDIAIVNPAGLKAGADTLICVGDSVQLNATGGLLYNWSYNITLSDSTIANPYAKPKANQKYIATIVNGPCRVKDTVIVNTSVIHGDAGADRIVCLGDSIKLNAIGGITYKWKYDLTLSDSTKANPYAKPSASTKYYVLINDGVCRNTDSVTVNIVIPSNMNAGIDATVCLGDSIRLNATGGLQYAWSPKSKLSDSTIANPYTKPVSDQTYYVNIRNGVCKITDSVTVFVKTVIADAGANESICLGDSIQLNASGGVAYEWQTNITLTDSTIANPYAKPQSDTKYFVKVKDGLCSNIDSVTIAISPSPNMDAGIDVSVCEKDSVPLYVQGNVDSFVWKPTTGLSDATILNPKTSPHTTTEYIIRGKLGQCFDEDTLIVTVNPNPTIDIGIDTVKCVDEFYTFDPIVSNGDQYSWQPSSLLDNPLILNPTTSTNTAERFILTVTNSTTGCTSSDSIWLRSQKPTAQFELDDTATLSPPLIVKPTNTSYPLPLQYAWEMLDSISASYSDFEPTHSFLYDGRYKILLTVTDELGCTDTLSRYVTISSPVEIKFEIPNVFTPNRDGKNDIIEIRVPPGMLQSMQASIWNRWGTKVFEFSYPDRLVWDGTIDGQDASAGVYYYIIEAVDLNNKNHQMNGTITLLR